MYSNNANLCKIKPPDLTDLTNHTKTYDYNKNAIQAPPLTPPLNLTSCHVKPKTYSSFHSGKFMLKKQ